MNTQIFVPIVLIVIGFGLILAEILLLPGLITGIVGFGLILWGIIYSYLHFGGNGAAVSIVLSLIAGGILLYLMVKLRLWRRFVLESDQKPEEGFVAPDASLKDLVGKEAECFSFLRPSGQVTVEGKRYDAISQAAFIEKGTKVSVVSVSGQQLVVTDREQKPEGGGPNSEG